MINTILLHIDILEVIYHIFNFLFNIIIGIISIALIIFVPYFIGKIVSDFTIYDPVENYVVGFIIILILCIFIYACYFYA